VVCFSLFPFALDSLLILRSPQSYKDM